MRPPQSLCLCFSLQALCYLRLEMFKSWPRRAASSFVQYNTGCVVPCFLYAYESVFPINLPKLFTHQWIDLSDGKILNTMEWLMVFAKVPL